MQDHEADFYVERYEELRRDAGLRASNLVAMTGTVCRTCKVGRKTRIVTRRGERPGDKVTQEVCDTCWARLVAKYGPSQALSAIAHARWDDTSSVERDVIKGLEVTLYPRKGASEIPLMRRTDAWRVLQPIFEVRPRASSLVRWRQGVEAWILYMSACVGTRASVCEVGEHCHPELGPWTENRVRGAVEYARVVSWARIRRLSTPQLQVVRVAA